MEFMKKRSFLPITTIVGIATMFLAVGIYAGTEVGDVIKMENAAYKKHTKSLVMFSHKKHVEEYKAGCGECHHDENNKPLNNLKKGDAVKNCIECHKKAGYITGKAAKGLTAKQKREYHANALHDNCKSCHQKFNKKKGLKSTDPAAAPTTCTGCHPKAKK